MDDNLSLKIDDKTVERVRSFKFLGAVVNDTLTWVDHIDMVCNKVSRSLNLLRRLSWFLPQPLLPLYLKSYILPHFDYYQDIAILFHANPALLYISIQGHVLGACRNSLWIKVPQSKYDT